MLAVSQSSLPVPVGGPPSSVVLRVHDPCETFLVDPRSRESCFSSSKNDFPLKEIRAFVMFPVSRVPLASRQLREEGRKREWREEIHTRTIWCIIVFNYFY